jgi:hypothetical protein
MRVDRATVIMPVRYAAAFALIAQRASTDASTPLTSAEQTSAQGAIFPLCPDAGAFVRHSLG